MKRNKKQLYESIMKDLSKSIKSKLNEEYEYEDNYEQENNIEEIHDLEEIHDVEEIDDVMFQEALLNYGELDLVDLEDELDEPIIINNRVVKSLYADEDNMYYSFEKNGQEYEKEFFIDYLTDEECDIIYQYLMDNEDPNQEFFSSLPQDDYDDDDE